MTESIIEWSAWYTHFWPSDEDGGDVGGHHRFPMCPVCGGVKPGVGADDIEGLFTGHAPDCAVRALLDEHETFVRTIGEVLFDGDGWANETATIAKATDVVEELREANKLAAQRLEESDELYDEGLRLKARVARLRTKLRKTRTKLKKARAHVGRGHFADQRSGARIQYRGPLVQLDLRVEGVRRLIWDVTQIGINAWTMRRAA